MKSTETFSLENRKLLAKFGIVLTAVYLLAMGILYFLAHDQLYYQYTQGYCEYPQTDYAIAEVCEGTYIAEVFEPGMDVIDSISVLVINYLRDNSGKLILELYDNVDQRVLGTAEYNMIDIPDMSFVGIEFDEPVYMANHQLTFKMYSENSPQGQAVAPMVNTSIDDEHGVLIINDKEIKGRLGISAEGRQTIWVGPCYPYIILVGLVAIVFFVLGIYFKLVNQKLVYSFLIIGVIKKYSFLISQLVGTSFRTKYKRSVLGVFWSFLNPLLTMIVQYIVFSNLFKFDMEYYHIYLLIGITIFSFFSTGVSRTIWSIIGHAQLIKKVYVPKWIYPFAEVLSSFVDFMISIIPLFVLVIFSGIKYSKTIWLILFPLVCILVFTIGFGMMMSALMVYFRDVEHIWGVLSMVWMYGTPIFYPISILPDQVAGLIKMNPLYIYIDFSRTCIMQGISPYPGEYVKCAVSAIIMFGVGTYVFKKMQDGFLLRI